MKASVVSSLSLRPAGAADVAWLVRTRNELASYFLSPTPATTAQTFRLLAASKTYIVECEDKRIGTFAFYNVQGTEAEFGRFMLLRQLQGLGRGSEIMQMAFMAARELGLRSLRLTMRNDNDVARVLYTHAGFRTVGHLNGTVEMRKELT